MRVFEDCDVTSMSMTSSMTIDAP